MLRAFPFSLKDAAREWLMTLPAGSIATWLQLKIAFLEKYFPAARSSHLKKELATVEQMTGETMYEYWERFKKMCAACPYHGYNHSDLVLYFCDGLLPEDARMVNAASGGGIANKGPNAALALITELAVNSRNLDKRSSTRRVAMATSSNSSLETEVQELKFMMKNFMSGTPP
jgi:hypothetical protein